MSEQQVIEETVTLDRSLSQFFTPAWLAERVWHFARAPIHRGCSVLEPSAGRGALIEPIAAELRHVITAYEIDPRNAACLREKHWGGLDVREGDFLAECAAGNVECFHLAIVNPPFENNQDIAFLEACCDRAWSTVAICQSRILHSKGRAAFWSWHDIHRMAILSARPRFGGDQGGKTDFMVLDLRRRRSIRKQGEASTSAVEWWT